MEEQLPMGFPGLGQEVREICVELGLPDATRLDTQKKVIKETIKLNRLNDMKAEMMTRTSSKK